MTDRVPDPCRRRWLCAAAACAALPADFARAQTTQSSPTAQTGQPGPQAAQLPPLKILVGFPGGAGVDPMARAIAEKLRGGRWVNVIVDNRPGAGGRLAIEALKQAPPDGTTLLLTPASSLTLFPHVFRKLSYDPVKDLMPVTQAFSYQMGMIAGPANPARTLADYAAWVRRDPKNAFFAIPALGSVPHFLASMYQKAAGLDLQPVAYRGSGPVWNDLLGGQIPTYFSPIANEAITRHRAGQARILATAGARRSVLLPEVPTFAESGYPGVRIDEWFGYFAPPGTPEAMILQTNAALHAALQHPDVVALLEKSLAVPEPTTPTALADRIRAEISEWAVVVKESGFKPED